MDNKINLSGNLNNTNQDTDSNSQNQESIINIGENDFSLSLIVIEHNETTLNKTSVVFASNHGDTLHTESDVTGASSEVIGQHIRRDIKQFEGINEFPNIQTTDLEQNGSLTTLEFVSSEPVAILNALAGLLKKDANPDKGIEEAVIFTPEVYESIKDQIEAVTSDLIFTPKIDNTPSHLLTYD